MSFQLMSVILKYQYIKHKIYDKVFKREAFMCFVSWISEYVFV
jgi:hypothetical protein